MEGDNQHGQDVTEFRAGHEFDVKKLESYLVQHVSDLVAPIELKQFKLGQSNPSFFVVDAKGSKFVVRKKPPGSLISKQAHAVEREYKVIRALSQNSNYPVPKAYVLCEDSSVIGSPFFVMSFIAGRIFSSPLLPTVPYNDRRTYYFEMIDQMAHLHKIDVKKVGLEDYGRLGGYYERQLKNLSNLSKVQGSVKDKTGNPIGPMTRQDELEDWLRKNMVADEVTLFHGDIKSDNVIYDMNEPKIVAVLDWELSTIGHPLADLAHTPQMWYTPAPKGLRDAPRPLPIPEADELIRRYCQTAGREYPIKNWAFCIVFAMFRGTVIRQGIAARVALGQNNSAYAANYVNFRELGDICLEVLDGGPLSKLTGFGSSASQKL
ncbi:hypothetical protein SmJEL517_g01743 [Synchytrium microbalum]|uniref:Aminoglycoside phosphotransferase domain-containing protein n=1 Tax=Synchytrium microbalum TaxID=1806994 RepID=A0A507CDC5_9FUNG|nr:uncharacterized protein SmJEL517_g01743 [Synchytrium microbalum]TPX35924.1 hypothetical protein SmJEL517_g01743 [Synchytrium microbalum]